jgi:hypothetical protein
MWGLRNTMMQQIEKIFTSLDEAIITSNSKGIGFCNKKGLQILMAINYNTFKDDQLNMGDFLKDKKSLNYEYMTKPRN